MAKRLDLTITQGDTFERLIRWEMPPFIYKAITGITKTAPARVTAVGHGLTDGWRVAVVSVKGMSEINAQNNPPRDSDFTPITFIDNDTVDLNAVNAADFATYTGGGYLQFYTPVDLSGYTARMEIKDRVGGTILLSLTSGLNGGITVDPTAQTILLVIDPDVTAGFGWIKGTYDLEMVGPAGAVTKIFSGAVKVLKEVTT